MSNPKLVDIDGLNYFWSKIKASKPDLVDSSTGVKLTSCSFIKACLQWVHYSDFAFSTNINAYNFTYTRNKRYILFTSASASVTLIDTVAETRTSFTSPIGNSNVYLTRLLLIDDDYILHCFGGASNEATAANKRRHYKASVEDGVWTQMNNVPPSSLSINSDSVFVDDGGDIYLVCSGSLYKYDGATDTWTALDSAPVSINTNYYRHVLDHSGYNNFIRQNGSWTSSGTFYSRYKFKAGVWTELTDTTHLWNCSFVIREYNDILYALLVPFSSSSSTSGGATTLKLYVLKDDVWTRVSDDQHFFVGLPFSGSLDAGNLTNFWVDSHGLLKIIIYDKGAYVYGNPLTLVNPESFTEGD